jgi:hypothetical protein
VREARGMIRFLFRLLGFLLLAGAFVSFVIDGTRSIAASALRVTSLGQTLEVVAPGKVAQLQPMLEKLHPKVWDPAAQWLLGSPTAAVLAVIGLVLLWIGRPRRELIGYATR